MVCLYCHRSLRILLRAKIRGLENARKAFHWTSTALHTNSPAQHALQSIPRSLYYDTIGPTAIQASAASQFFEIHRPRVSWVADEWRKQAYSPPPTTSTFTSSPGNISTPLLLLTPEIAFLGRSNTGKSSLLNALLQSPGLCRVGSKPGKTTTMHAWTLSASPKTKLKPKTTSTVDISDRLTVLDMPGYGHGSHDEWGTDIVRYLKRRRQLRRAMVLLNPKHGMKEGDEKMLHLLRTNGISHQIVACKCDTLPVRDLHDRLMQLRAQIKNSEQESNMQGSTLCIDDILVVGELGDGKMNKTHNPHSAFGINDVRWAILQAVGLDEFAVQQCNQIHKKQETLGLKHHSKTVAQNIKATT